MPKDAPPAPRRRVRLILAVAALGLLLAAAVLYAARRTIAREALTGWLEARGIASDVQVERFGLSGFTGRVQVGDPARPDFLAEQVEVGYRLRPYGVEVTSVRLRAPVLRASWRGGKFSAGALDPVIAEFMRRPPRPDAAQPRITIERGVLMLTTDYGAVRVRANALVEDLKLVSVDAVAAPTQLKGAGFDAATGAATFKLRTTGDRVAADLDMVVPHAKVGEVDVKAGRLKLAAQLPYPDLKRRRGDGAVVIRADLTASQLETGGQGLADTRVVARFDGRSNGWIETLALSGAGGAELRAVGGVAAGARAELVRAAVDVPDLRWTRSGGDAVNAQISGRGGADRLAMGDLRLQQLTTAFDGQAAWRGGKVSAAITAAAAGRGTYQGLGASTGADSAEVAAVKRAARSFRLAAPQITLTMNDSGWAVGLPQAARLVADAGGAATLSARSGAPLLSAQGGALRLAVAGGGLPKVDADVSRLRLEDGAVTAVGRVQAAGSVAMVQGGAVDASGQLRARAGAVTFTADRCASFQAARLEMGDNDVERLAGRLCPAGGPLFALAGGGWRLAGRVEAASAAVPFGQVRLADAGGRVEATQRGEVLAVEAQLSQGRLIDAAPQTRFHPLGLSGPVALARGTWTAAITATTPSGTPLARANLTHDMAAGRGGLALDTGLLSFAPGGLQPAALSPLAAAIGSPAQGTARFTGHFDWTAEGLATGGALSIPGLDFMSPAGAVTGLSGDVVFTSLVPLVAAPGQVLRVKGVATLAPLSEVTATFSIDEKGLVVSGGEAQAGGGRIIIERLELPLATAAPIKGVLGFEGVQLHDLVEATPFGDKIDFSAKVSGRIPFELIAGRVHVQGGELRAIEPGRLSINRAVLSGLGEAPGDATSAPPTSNMINDLAYQALENLAFDAMDAKIDSLPAGRVGVLFHLVGKYDPPQRQSIKLTLAELISRSFMTKPLALPSNTAVNLTLDSTLNLDDLLDDFAAYLRLRGSGRVQP